MSHNLSLFLQKYVPICFKSEGNVKDKGLLFILIFTRTWPLFRLTFLHLSILVYLLLVTHLWIIYHQQIGPALFILDPNPSMLGMSCINATSSIGPKIRAWKSFHPPLISNKVLGWIGLILLQWELRTLFLAFALLSGRFNVNKGYLQASAELFILKSLHVIEAFLGATILSMCPKQIRSSVTAP